MKKRALTAGKTPKFENAGQKGQRAHEEAEVSGVADFKELGEGQGAGFAEAVEDESGDGDEQDDRVGEFFPVGDDETGDEINFEAGHGAGEPRVGFALGVGEQVAAGAASCGKEIGDAFDEAVGVDGEGSTTASGTKTKIQSMRGMKWSAGGRDYRAALRAGDSTIMRAFKFCRLTRGITRERMVRLEREREGKGEWGGRRRVLWDGSRRCRARGPGTEGRCDGRGRGGVQRRVGDDGNAILLDRELIGCGVGMDFDVEFWGGGAEFNLDEPAGGEFAQDLDFEVRGEFEIEGGGDCFGFGEDARGLGVIVWIIVFQSNCIAGDFDI